MVQNDDRHRLPYPKLHCRHHRLLQLPALERAGGWALVRPELLGPKFDHRRRDPGRRKWQAMPERPAAWGGMGARQGGTTSGAKTHDDTGGKTGHAYRG